MKVFKPVILIFLLFCGLQIHAQVAVKAKLKSLLNDSTERVNLAKHYPIIEILDSLYQENDYKPIFSHGMSAMYIKYVKESAYWGFNPSHYKYELLDSLFRSRDPHNRVILDFELCTSYLSLAEDILNGVLKSEKTRGDKIHFGLEKFDAFELLKATMDLPSISHIKLLEPEVSAYQETKNLLQHYQVNSANYPVHALIFKDSLQLGDRDTMVIALRNQLYFLGDLKMEEKLKSPIFDKDVQEALSNFQLRNLLPSNGILDARTSEKLHFNLADLIAEMQINLERWRWLPRDLGEYYAIAILPAFEMSLVKNDSLLLRQRIVCGKVGRNTPAFSAKMSYVDINPTWTVPPTILQKDILPAAKRNSSYLSNKNIKVLDVTTGTYVSSASINWAKAGNYKFVQGPGLSNSLGVVKFIFPNNYYIFFHDTPHKEHFPLAVRAFSSGCIRLAQPIDFAEILLSYNKETYSKAKIDSVVSTQKTKRIMLEQQPEVYIHYLTQEFKDGLFYTYPDVYGYNKELLHQFLLATKD